MVEFLSGSDAQWHPVAIAKHGALLQLYTGDLADKLGNAHIMVLVNLVLLLSTWHVQPSQSPTVF